MRTKKDILIDTASKMGKPFIGETTALVNQHLILEVFIDIRDILNERLLEIDRGIHELTTTTEAVIKDAATAIILGKEFDPEQD